MFWQSSPTPKKQHHPDNATRLDGQVIDPTIKTRGDGPHATMYQATTTQETVP